MSNAFREGHRINISKFHNNLGGACLYQLKYHQALSHFVEARESAGQLGEPELEAGNWLNMASLYTLVGAGEAAERAIHEAIRLMPPGSGYLPRLLSQRVRIVTRQGDYARAAVLWGEAIQAAQTAGDFQSESNLWDVLAMIRMKEGDLGAADDALANELRLVQLHGLPNRDFVCTRIGRLRLAQARPAEALHWFDLAGRHRRTTGSAAIPWTAAQDRAAALLAAGRAEEALNEYRRAWRLALAWRDDVLPAQSTEIAADVTLANLAEQYAAHAISSAARHGRSALIREAWAAVEQGRAAGLRRRTLMRQATLRHLGPEYRQLLSTLRQAAIRGVAPAIGIQARLTELEANAGIASARETRLAYGGPEDLIRQVQSGLGRGETMFTFLLAEPHSYAWAVTRTDVHLAVLPGRRELSASIQAFRRSVMENRADLQGHSRTLFATLFGGLPERALRSRRWLLSQDDALYQAPLAALRDTTAAGAPYLVESRILQSIPSALWILHAVRAASSVRMLAVGDAIHNGADARLLASRPTFAPLSFWIWPWRQQPPAPLDTLELPTLAGSLTEVESISSIWRRAGRHVSVLKGAEASQNNVEAALRGGYSAFHFATHVVPAPESSSSFLLQLRPGAPALAAAVSSSTPGDPFLTLSINRSGYREGIDAGILAAYDLPGALVVLNGCDSGSGTVQAGAGLLGFTSAWLAAGARSVVASLWPVDDNGGELFARFHQSVLTGAPPAESLRAAQLAMIRSESWRTQPRHWAAYFSVGKE